MKIRLLTVIFLLYLAIDLVAQSALPKIGLYRNVVELKRQTPYLEQKIDLVRYSEIEPFYYDKDSIFYKPIPVKGIKSKTLKKRIGFICDGENLFVNCFRYGMGYCYIKIIEYGKYSYFIGKPILDVRQKRIIEQAAFYGGIAGLATSSIIISSLNRDRIYYVINLESGVLNYLDKPFMEWVLRNHPDLLSEFKNESDTESLDVLIAWLKKINERVKG